MPSFKHGPKQRNLDALGAGAAVEAGEERVTILQRLWSILVNAGKLAGLIVLVFLAWKVLIEGTLKHVHLRQFWKLVKWMFGSSGLHIPDILRGPGEQPDGMTVAGSTPMSPAKMPESVWGQISTLATSIAAAGANFSVGRARYTQPDPSTERSVALLDNATQALPEAATSFSASGFHESEALELSRFRSGPNFLVFPPMTQDFIGDNSTRAIIPTYLTLADCVKDQHDIYASANSCLKDLVSIADLGYIAFVAAAEQIMVDLSSCLKHAPTSDDKAHCYAYHHARAKAFLLDHASEWIQQLASELLPNAVDCLSNDARATLVAQASIQDRLWYTQTHLHKSKDENLRVAGLSLGGKENITKGEWMAWRRTYRGCEKALSARIQLLADWKPAEDELEPVFGLAWRREFVGALEEWVLPEGQLEAVLTRNVFEKLFFFDRLAVDSDVMWQWLACSQETIEEGKRACGQGEAK